MINFLAVLGFSHYRVSDECKLYSAILSQWPLTILSVSIIRFAPIYTHEIASRMVSTGLDLWLSIRLVYTSLGKYALVRVYPRRRFVAEILLRRFMGLRCGDSRRKKSVSYINIADRSARYQSLLARRPLRLFSPYIVLAWMLRVSSRNGRMELRGLKLFVIVLVLCKWLPIYCYRCPLAKFRIELFSTRNLAVLLIYCEIMHAVVIMI